MKYEEPVLQFIVLQGMNDVITLSLGNDSGEGEDYWGK